MIFQPTASSTVFYVLLSGILNKKQQKEPYKNAYVTAK